MWSPEGEATLARFFGCIYNLPIKKKITYPCIFLFINYMVFFFFVWGGVGVWGIFFFGGGVFMAHCGHSIFETKLAFVLCVCVCVCVYIVFHLMHHAFHFSFLF